MVFSKNFNLLYNQFVPRQVTLNFANSQDSKKFLCQSKALRCAWAIALIYMVVQVYVLYMNTYHLFAGAPPMCQICAALDSYDGSTVASTSTLSIVAVFVVPVFIQKQSDIQSLVSNQFPRAPPHTFY